VVRNPLTITVPTFIDRLLLVWSAWNLNVGTIADDAVQEPAMHSGWPGVLVLDAISAVAVPRQELCVAVGFWRT
jgi:hypothetical protein